jgi:3-oxoacyl-[acyl-carrier-protein] synthase III
MFPTQEDAMDNLTKKEQSDRSQINMHQDFEVKYWTKELGVSKEQLQNAVDKVGNSAAAVRKELGAR